MNIVIPKDKSVGYFVLDMRDALEGQEMNFGNGKNSLPECVIVVPKSYLSFKENGKIDLKVLKTYFKEMTNKEYCADIKFALTKLINAQASFKKGVKIILMEKGEESVIVPAPLWNASVQLIEIIVKNPITELGETEKFIDVTDVGCCSCDVLFEVVPDCKFCEDFEQFSVNYNIDYGAKKKNTQKQPEMGMEL